MQYNKTRIELGALATGMFYASQKDRIEAFNRIRQIIFRDIEKKVMRNKEKEGAPQRLLHADLRARRKMVKIFLIHYYEKCLLLRGMKPDKPYSARFHKNN